jgi:hypothetical protein
MSLRTPLVSVILVVGDRLLVLGDAVLLYVKDICKRWRALIICVVMSPPGWTWTIHRGFDGGVFSVPQQPSCSSGTCPRAGCRQRVMRRSSGPGKACTGRRNG